LHAKAEEVEAAIRKVDGVVDTNAGIIVSGPAVTFRIDPKLAAGFGVSAADISSAVETALTGTTTSIILQYGRPVNVRVTFPPGARDSLETLRGLQIRASTGAQFRLDQVATIDYDKGQTEINRDGLRQTDSVTARVTGTDLGTAINNIKSQLAASVKLPAGMTVEYGGLYAEQQASFRELALALVLAVVLVFLYCWLNSVRSPTRSQ
jgi:Cu/Ag efflux pump CusA